jgi:hypothetical protein
MFEFFHQVSAQYSNAVLVAILPLISDFVKKAELPMPTPITLQQVREFRCWTANDGDVGGAVVLTNGLWTWFQRGHVRGFRTPHSYYFLQDPRFISEFYGPLRMDREQALKFARDSIIRLGYTLKETFTDQEPVVDGPIQVGTNVVPHYRFQWKDPVFGTTAVCIEVDAGRKMLQEVDLLSRFFWRLPPKIAVESGLPNRQPPTSVAASNQFLAAALPSISKYARQLRLPLNTPVLPKNVQRVEFVGSTAQAWLRLKSGHWFVIDHGEINAFYSRDAVFNGPPAAFDPFPLPAESYLGRWRMSEVDAIALVRKSIERLGFRPVDFYAQREPEVTKHQQVGQYVVPRYFIKWLTNSPATGLTVAMVAGEVDANKRSLASLCLVGDQILPGADGGNLRPAKTATGASGTNENSIESALEYLERRMGFATNGTNKAVPPAKRVSPFE